MSYIPPSPIPTPNNFNYNYFQNLTDNLNLREADDRYLRLTQANSILNLTNGIADANKALVLNSSKEILGITKLQIGSNLNIVGGDFGILNTNSNARFRIGSNQSLGNCMTFQWTYVGDNNNSNKLGIDFFGKSDQFCILNNGNIGIGIGNPSFQLHLSTDSAAKPSTNVWTISSDERIKENIEDANLDICYNNIKNLKLKRYKYKDNFIKNHNLKDKYKLGWIAQDVKQFFNKSVIINKNEDYNIEDFHSLDSDQIIASLYGAVQKLQLQYDEIKNIVDNIEFE